MTLLLEDLTHQKGRLGPQHTGQLVLGVYVYIYIYTLSHIGIIILVVDYCILCMGTTLAPMDPSWLIGEIPQPPELPSHRPDLHRSAKLSIAFQFLCILTGADAEICREKRWVDFFSLQNLGGFSKACIEDFFGEETKILEKNNVCFGGFLVDLKRMCSVII